ncbi:MAG TPA: SAM-dependent methyltransferase, partial [Desulfohalobiaceae bacterium]|nr:SAM-dependent methyltransferase [Desulfohalobiaceae bacterium]
KPMLGDNGFVILTSPHTLLNKKNSSSSNLFKDLSNHNPTFVLYMALNSMDKIVQRLKKYYPNDLPAAVVYYAGYQDKEKVIRGTITNINEKIKKYGKEWLGLVIIGKCLST